MFDPRERGACAIGFALVVFTLSPNAHAQEGSVSSSNTVNSPSYVTEEMSRQDGEKSPDFASEEEIAVGRAFGKAGEDRVLRWIQQLRDPAPSYRLQAVARLGRLGTSAASALPALFDRLHDVEPNVRLAAVQALVEIAERPLETANALLPILDDSNEHVRYAAEWGLARIALALDSDYRQLPRSQTEELLAVLEKALGRIDRRAHHKRHRQVIEATLAQVSEQLSAQQAQDLERTQQLALKEQELAARERKLKEEWEAAQQILRAERQQLTELREIVEAFDLSDSLEQLRIIYRLKGPKPDWPEEALLNTRVQILKQAALRSEWVSLQAMLGMWDNGRSVLMRLFDELPADAALPDWSASILAEVRTRTDEDAEKLSKMAARPASSDAIRRAATTALMASEHGTYKCIERLEGILVNNEEDLFLRMRAAEALGRLAQRDNVLLGETTGERVVNSLLGVLRDRQQRWSLRISAARACSRFEHAKQASEILLEAANTQELPEYELRSVISTLTELGLPFDEPFLAMVDRALRSPDDLARQAAMQAIAATKTTTSDQTERLLSMLADFEETAAVRLEIVKTMAGLGPEFIVMAAERVPAATESCQLQILKALSRLGEEAQPATPICIHVLEDPEQPLSVRCAAATVLAATGKRTSPEVRALHAFTKAKIPAPAQAIALVALAELSSDYRSVVEGLDSREPAIQVATTYLRALAGEPTGIVELTGLLRGETAGLAAKALEELGADARPALIQLLADADAQADHRVTAFTVLTRIPSEDFGPLVKAIADAQIGERCQQEMVGLLATSDRNLLFELVAALEASQESGTRQRFEKLIQTRLSGLGAAAEDHDLQLNNHLADGLLRELEDREAAGFSQVWSGSSQTTGTLSAAGGNIRLPSAPALSQSNSSAYSSSAFPDAEGQNQARDQNQKREQNLKPRSANRRLASRPEEIEEATIAGAASDDPSSDSAAAVTEAWPHKVQVYYGTNRKPLGVWTRENYLTHSQSMFAFAAIAALAVCVFGFLRSRATLYAVFAIAGLACVSIFLVQNADNHSSEVERPPVPYSNEYHDQLAWGTCQVSIPQGHVPGELESPAFHRFEFKPNLRKHVVLTKTKELEPNDFFQELHQELERSGPGVLVFIHGYNVSFEDAARRTAQMSHDLQFAGAPVFYSWPSQANWWEYQLDKKNIRRSVNQIKEFLTSLAEKSGAETINVVAHSMGNVGLTEALSEIEAEGEQALFNQVVLAAPDIDADIFRDRIAPNIVDKAQRLTLYASSNDLALKASKYFNAGHRAGDSSGPLNVFPGLDVVDASAVDMSLLGHGYYGSSFGVLQDLAEVLMDLPTDQRSTLMAVSAGQQSIWMIDERLATSRQVGSQGTVR